jgi:hypothetical protein
LGFQSKTNAEKKGLCGEWGSGERCPQSARFVLVFFFLVPTLLKPPVDPFLFLRVLPAHSSLFFLPTSKHTSTPLSQKTPILWHFGFLCLVEISLLSAAIALEKFRDHFTKLQGQVEKESIKADKERRQAHREQKRKKKKIEDDKMNVLERRGR